MASVQEKSAQEQSSALRATQSKLEAEKAAALEALQMVRCLDGALCCPLAFIADVVADVRAGVMVAIVAARAVTVVDFPQKYETRISDLRAAHESEVRELNRQLSSSQSQASTQVQQLQVCPSLPSLSPSLPSLLCCDV